jgi:isopentenyl diphosphate isomerase/L-lactate dehydrogenase-like FMN-dependent dehydrogenase
MNNLGDLQDKYVEHFHEKKTLLSYGELYNKGMERTRESGALDLLDVGGETKSQNRLNREYIESLTFEMRLLDSVFASTETTLLGHKVPHPIQCSAYCDGRFLNRVAQHWQASYLEEIAEGIAEAGTWLWAGHVGTQLLQRMINTGAPVVRIVKPFASKNRDESQDIIYLLKDAEDRGCVAVGMDIDIFYGEKTGDEYPYRYPFGPKAMDEMRRFVEATHLPFIVKGVLSVSDALKCQEIGAEALMVSHHGGEAIDYAVPILRVLPHIKQAVPDMTIFVDTGFRRGTDILKALALGADGVCVLTILMIAYAGYGKRGVTDMIHNLAAELRRNMSICGCSTIDNIDPSIIWYPYPDPRRGE